MRKKINKKILFGVFGSLLIGVSSIVTPIMVISNTQKGVLSYSKKFNFSNEKDIRNSFKKVDISLDTTNSYINSIKNLKKSKSYSSSTSLLENIIEVQNEISLRRVNNNSSLEELNFDIKNVKNALKKDSAAYLNYQKIDETNYEYLRALYVKNNVDSWSSLNNVKKYDLIYNQVNSILEELESYYDLFNMKQLIYEKEIEARNYEIKNNNSQIKYIKSQINSQKDIVNKKQEEIKFLEKNLINSSEYFKEINQSWNEINGVYISATTFASIAAALSIISLIPIFGTGAFIAGTAAAVAASGLSVVLNVKIEILKSKIEKNHNVLWAVVKYISQMSVAFAGTAINIYLFLDKFISYIINSVVAAGLKLVGITAGISLLTALIQIGFMTWEYIKIRNKKDEYLSSIKKEFNNGIQNSIKKINLDISMLDGDTYKKNLEIINKLSLNRKLYDEIQNFSENSNLLVNHFNQLSSSITQIPLITKNKILQISEKSKKNIKKWKHKSLKELYNNIELFIISSKEKSKNRKQNKIEFYKIYNYDDKKYWNEFLFSWIEPLLNSTELLFI